MLTATQRARLAVVLVGARNPQNIGAAARALHDFGFGDLRVVNPFSPPFEAAQLEAKSAVGAASVMARANRFDLLATAIEDCTLTVGTTAIGSRELERDIGTLQQTAPEMRRILAAPEQRVALLFGSEKTGLTNDQLSHCQKLLTIPLFAPEGERHLSMNLGQAVAVCLYELSREGFEDARPVPQVLALAPNAGDRERLTQRLMAVMQATGYARRFPANAREHVVRQLAHRLAVTRDDAATFMGLFRAVERNQPEE